MLMIRLARIGKTKKPFFRVIISEKARDTFGAYLEELGSVNPHTNPRTVQLKAERVRYWLEHGAQASPAVHNLLVEQGIVKADKLRVWKPKRRKAKETAVPVTTEVSKAAAEKSA